MGNETTIKFKVGDKVRIANPSDFATGVDWVLVITEIMPGYSCFAYRIKYQPEHWTCPVYSHEIEKVSIKGEQLLFSFMEK